MGRAAPLVAPLIRLLAVAAVLAALPAAARAVEPIRPGALALGPGGVLYVADTTGGRILARRAEGSFRVVARGLQSPAGMAVASGGTIYAADEGHNRVVAIAPRTGTVRTIARISSPAAVALRRGQLYVAAVGGNAVVRIAARGALVRVAGTRDAGPAGVHGIGLPATEASADGPNGIAFDRAGNLFVAGSNTKTLLMVGRDGAMRLPAGRDGFYPRGNGGLVPDAAGDVLGIDGQRIVRITPRGIRTLVDFRGRRVAGLSGFEPNGIAADARGAIYVDTYVGNGSATGSALVEVRRGTLRVVWKT